MPPQNKRLDAPLRPPTIGWFFLGATETANARAFLRLCNTEDAVDELGLGLIRDAFSDEFFPGTSVIMTEARYLIFIPAMYRAIERSLQRGNVFDVHLKSREIQDRFRQSLRNLGRGKGVIGIGTDQLVRYPTDIYWAGLKALGIHLGDGGEAEYQRKLAAYHDSAAIDDNDGDPVSELGAPPSNWDRHFPYFDDGGELIDAQGRPARELNFELTLAEAEYLRDRYLGNPSWPEPRAALKNSQLAFLIRKGRSSRFRYPWDARYPQNLEQSIADARVFSAFAQGVTLHYYHLLLEKRRAAGLRDVNLPLDDAKAEWWSRGREYLKGWDVESFIERRGQRHGNDKFIARWTAAAISARSMNGLLQDQTAKALIVSRERSCKPAKARLTYSKYLEAWSRQRPLSASEFRLDYRSGIASTIVSRIVQGLASPQER